MTKENVKKIWVLATAATLAATALAGGCKSSEKREEQVDNSANEVDHNRMLVRLAFAENVYNSVAAERAVYPKDFHAHSAELNRLGKQRAELLVHASLNTTAPVVVVRGDADDELYAARIAAVRQELIDGGMTADEIRFDRDTHVGGGSVSSDRALLSYDRMMSDYAPKAQQGQPTGDVDTLGSNGSSGSGSKTSSGSSRN
jgi:hypothetical protein